MAGMLVSHYPFTLDCIFLWEVLSSPSDFLFLGQKHLVCVFPPQRSNSRRCKDPFRVSKQNCIIKIIMKFWFCSHFVLSMETSNCNQLCLFKERHTLPVKCVLSPWRIMWPSSCTLIRKGKKIMCVFYTLSVSSNVWQFHICFSNLKMFSNTIL